LPKTAGEFLATGSAFAPGGRPEGNKLQKGAFHQIDTLCNLEEIIERRPRFCLAGTVAFPRCKGAFRR